MLTLNASAHPLMRRMHRPEVDPKTKEVLPPERQDRRSLVLVEPEDVDQWLLCLLEDAKALIHLTPVDRFDAGSG